MEDISERLAHVEDRAKNNTRRIEDLERKQDQIGELVTNMALLAQRQDSMEKDVHDIKDIVTEQQQKRARRWDSIIDKVLLTIITAIMSYVLIKIGF